jgi:hypothetical protein
VKCLEGVLLDVHCQHRGHTTWVDIRTKTGCRTFERIGVVSIGGCGNLTSCFSQQKRAFSYIQRQASDRNPGAEQIEHTI